MKRKFQLTLICLFPFFSYFAQAQKKSYFDVDEKKVSSSAQSYYYQIIDSKADASVNNFAEYYSKDDRPKQLATLKDPKNLNSFIGSYQRFYPNGQLAEKKHFNQDSKLVDSAFLYYDTGVIHEIVFYKKPTASPEFIGDKDDNRLYILQQDSTGKVSVEQGNGHFFIGDSSSGKYYEHGMLKNHKRDGLWVGKSSKYSFEETWKKGKLSKGLVTNPEGQVSQYDESNMSIPPVYPGGIDAFGRAVINNFVYPKEAIKAGASGRVVINFVVEAIGEMSSFNVKEEVGYGIGIAALEALQKSKRKWTPATQRGRPVRVAYSLPLTINLAP